jgi:hypothetical protein
MKYTIQGQGDINLAEQDYVGEGGEGKIYTRDNTLFKIYHDASKMIPAAKIQELAVLERANIIRPLDVLLNTRQTPVGFTMRKVERAVPLPHIFSSDFQRRQRLELHTLLDLLEHMRETIAFIHSQRCLLVDGNEMNFLLDERDLSQIYFIDVDSYQTPSFPATAQLPTICDYHSQGFSALTDWFAFAILACQVLIGIHPYKGKHPHVKGLEARMKANLSIFNAEVSLPAAVRDINIIPKPLHEWLVRVLEQGERCPPPALFGTATYTATAAVKTIHSSAQLVINKLREYPQPILAHVALNGIQVVSCADGVWLDDAFYPYPGKTLVLSPKHLQAVGFSTQQQMLHAVQFNNGQALTATIKAQRIFRANNAIYSVFGDKLTRLHMHEFAHIMLAPGASWSILPHAHTVLDGLVYQNVLGQPYLLVPYQQQGHDACFIQAIAELAGYTILQGRHENGVAMLLGYRDGRYDVLILRFSEDYQGYTARVLADVEQPQLNFSVLDNGVVVHILQDGELEIFRRHGEAVKVLQDPAIRGDMRLSHDGAQALFYQDNSLYAMRMQ